MPQATKPFYTEITRIEETKTSVIVDVILVDGGRATFQVTTPDVIGSYGFSCPSNDGAAFEWRSGTWPRCSERVAT